MKILRTHDVIRITGLSRTTLWRYEHTGNFPKKIQLGPNRVGYRSDEIEEWLSALPRAGNSLQNEETTSPLESEA